MFKELRLKHVGPASSMVLDFGDRLNLITGDNGLGKSFLLDIMWWSLTRKWPNPRLNVGKKLVLSFAPATDADAETIASYLPQPDENGNIDPADIPDTLPGYLVHLNGEFSIGDEVAATTLSLTMGTELLSEMGYWQPGRGWKTTTNCPVAGEYRAIALDLQGISPTQAEALKTDLEATQAKITAEDYTDLGKQQLVGDLLYSTILSYFVLNNIQDDLGARAANMVSYKAPSYGLFKTNVVPQYWFGIPRNVTIDGLTMDVDHITHLLVHESNDTDLWIAYNRASGARLSAMEHLVPEQMFSTEDNPAHGISAVKAIQIAAAEGQKIWTITKTNLSTALAAINLPSAVESDIRNSVYAGMEVTAHEQPVNFYGTSQVGYIVLDPETGADGYLIGGGENGGILKKIKGYLFKILFNASIFYGSAPNMAKLVLGSSVVGILFNIKNTINGIISLYNKCKRSANTFTASISFGMFFVLASKITLFAIALLNPIIAPFIVYAEAQFWNHLFSKVQDDLC